MSKSTNLENNNNTGNFMKLRNQKCGFYGILLWRRIQNLRKLAQLEIPKNRGELYNDVNIAKSNNRKNDENSWNILKSKNLGSREYYHRGYVTKLKCIRKLNKWQKKFKKKIIFPHRNWKCSYKYYKIK